MGKDWELTALYHQTEKTKKFQNLNLGCGEREFPDCLNVDMRKTNICDLQMNLEKLPWPFPDERFESVFAFDIIEHFTDVLGAMEEIHRVLKPGGIVYIHTSFWLSENSFTDPTHKHFFTLRSFNFFDPETEEGKKYHYYTKKKFKVEVAQVDHQELYFELRKI